MTIAVPPTRHSEINSTGSSWDTEGVERGIVSILRGANLGPFIDVVLVVAAAVVLGLTVGYLLADVATGLAITLGTTVVFRFVLGALTMRETAAGGPDSPRDIDRLSKSSTFPDAVKPQQT